MAESKAEQVDAKSKKNPTEFLALNDFCCLEIFKYLPLNDVCALSQTCRRLHALGTSHFMLNYDSKVLVYIDWSGRWLHTFPYPKDGNYNKCFAKNIQNVTLLKHFSTIECMEKLNMIYADGSPIKTIRFLDWKVDVSRALCTPIAAILNNVESLTIENSAINAELKTIDDAKPS